MQEKIRHVKISTIKVGRQFRKDLGDLEELAESNRQGLLQPIDQTTLTLQRVRKYQPVNGNSGSPTFVFNGGNPTNPRPTTIITPTGICRLR